MLGVSIIMGVYNCESTLAEAIDSIINQTYKDWELIMYDDGSIDNTYAIAFEYSQKYKNIHIYRNEKNLGLNKTLNNCLNHAQGKYIARMDGDDISLPTRLEKEFDFLEKNSEFGFVSTPMIHFDDFGEYGKGSCKPEPTIVDMMKGTPFCHAPCMVRKEVFEMVGGYSENRDTLRVEDYDLWVRVYAEGYKGYNLQENLYMMRDDRNALNRRKYKYRINEVKVKINALKQLNPPKYTIIYIIRPLLVGILPDNVYRFLHKKRINKKGNV